MARFRHGYGLEWTEVTDDATSGYQDLSHEGTMAEPCEPRQPKQTMALVKTYHPVSTRRRGAPVHTQGCRCTRGASVGTMTAGRIVSPRQAIGPCTETGEHVETRHR
jgi:hypothetical protein